MWFNQLAHIAASLVAFSLICHPIYDLLVCGCSLVGVLLSFYYLEINSIVYVMCLANFTFVIPLRQHSLQIV